MSFQNPGLPGSIPMQRMRLEPEQSYSREGSGFLGYIRDDDPTFSRESLQMGI